LSFLSAIVRALCWTIITFFPADIADGADITADFISSFKKHFQIVFYLRLSAQFAGQLLPFSR